jgi:hypothetical protein
VTEEGLKTIAKETGGGVWAITKSNLR